MASVIIDSGEPSPTDRPSYIPKDKWRSLMSVKRDFLAVNIQHDCRCLIEFIEDAKEMWQELGFKSSEDMIRNGYELDPQEVKLAVEWLKIKDPNYKIPYVDVIAFAKANPLREGPGGMNQYSDYYNVKNQKPPVGNSRSYLLRRLARDHPEALDKIESGEFKSARQAAIAYGIVKPTTPIMIVRRNIKKLSKEELHVVKDEIEKLLN